MKFAASQEKVKEKQYKERTENLHSFYLTKINGQDSEMKELKGKVESL
jgi:hypothetical protein